MDRVPGGGDEATLRMQRGLAMALGLAPEFFEGNDTCPGETMLHLRLVHYPPIHRLTPAEGQLGCGAHTDYGSLTVLADDGVGGLQVRQRNGAWTDVVIPDGQLVVNLGDLMAIWTNDRWVSNPHRVVNPPGVDRYSAVLFVTPPFNLRIETLPTCLGPGVRRATDHWWPARPCCRGSTAPTPTAIHSWRTTTAAPPCAERSPGPGGACLNRGR